MRVCVGSSDRCPTARLIPKDKRRCPECAAQYEKARGTKQQRGYGKTHQAERARWTRTIQAAGSIPCARCGRPITADTAWHLDHTDDRTGYLGPSCVPCNTAAGGRAAHQ